MFKSLPQNVYMPVLRFLVQLLGTELLVLALSAIFLGIDATSPRPHPFMVFYTWTNLFAGIVLAVIYGCAALKWGFDL